MKRDAIVRGSLLLLGLLGWCAASALAGAPRPATDEDIKKMIAAAGDAKKYDNAALVTVLDEADVFVQDSGLATTESCEIVKILTDAGIRARSVYRMEFDPATNRISLKSVRIHRKGGTIEDVPVSSMITPPAKQHSIYWGNREHLLSIPRLEIGDCLEIRTSKIGYNIAYLDGSGDQPGSAGGAAASPAGEETLQPPMPGHWYEVTEFQNDHPIIKKRYSVYMPKDKPVQYEVYNGSLKSSLWFTDKYHVYTFWAEDIAPVKREPFMTGSADVATKLVMATIPDWFAKSKWFFNANESQFEADDAIKAKVHELTDGLPDEEAKIKACLHWVADNVRYYGTSRGPCEGFTLHKGTETFRDRGGVCKDKAGMLVTMLRVLGLEVYPSLTMAGTRVEAIPADQFNHTVTVMRNKDGTFRILDPTWSPLSKETWSSWEAQQGLVYGTPEGQDLTLSPYYPPEHNRLIYNGTSQIAEDGRLTTNIVMDMANSPCTAFRRSIDRFSKPDQRGFIEETLAISPNARLEELKHTDPFDYSQDTHVEMKVSAPTYASGGDVVWMFKLPMMQRPLGSFLLSDFTYNLTPERKLAVRMRATRLVQIEEKLQLPPGWKVDRVPEAKKMDSGSASLTFEVTPGDGVLTYRLEMKVKNNIIPPEDYAGFKKAMDTINELRDEWIVCSVGGEVKKS
ncbi:MAG TPA: DUF3857 domain-containing protein [Phycisphaerae bacterium]|nr:DUF3857 domain-containing protein [Phycisphaerae bacterium]